MTGFCTVALVLLIDVSGSVTADRMRLQYEGIAEALTSQQVVRQFTPESPVAVTVRSFSNRSDEVIGWRVLRGVGDAQAMAEEVRARPIREGWGLTGIAVGLNAALDDFSSTPCDSERQIIDVSGDGDDNLGGDTRATRDRAVAMGVEINALPILDPNSRMDLEGYFREHVVTPGNWVIVAHGYDDVSRALSMKLRLEIAGMTPDRG